MAAAFLFLAANPFILLFLVVGLAVALGRVTIKGCGLGMVASAIELPPGAAGGILAGAMTMSAAIGSAEQAVTTGAYALPPGVTAEQVSAMIALSYGVTYIWGTVGYVAMILS